MKPWIVLSLALAITALAGLMTPWRRVDRAVVKPAWATVPADRKTGLQISSQTTSPIASGAYGVWNHSGTPQWRDSGGGDTPLVPTSQTQNLVLASPNGSSGVPTYRALVAADIPSLSATYCALTGCTMSGALTTASPLTVGTNLVLSATGLTGVRTFTWPDASDTVAGLAATQTFTNHTWSGGTFSGTIAGTPTFSGNTTFSGAISANGTIVVGAKMASTKVNVADVNYTFLAANHFIAWTSLTAGRTLSVACNVTGASTQTAEVIVKDEAGTAGSNNITLSATSGTIDGSASKVIINTNFGAARFYLNGTNCYTW